MNPIALFDGRQRRVQVRWFAGLVVILLMLLVLASQAAADPGVPGVGSEPVGPASADDGYWDVGAEHQADAPPSGSGGSDLPLCQTSAVNFYNRLRAFGYTGSNSFLYANSLSWQTDWKRAAKGGSENYFADNVDIAYYCDHGNTGAVYFPWGHTSNWLVPNDCYQSWGDKDNEWMAFGTCLTLTDRGGWANCMMGQHLILGYITVSYDADEGGTWANQLLAGKTVTQAWFTMCDITQPSSVIARVIAEDSRHFSDKIWGKGGPAYGDYVDNYYYWLDHQCYKPVPVKVDPSAITAMPTYEVNQRQVDPAYVENIAGALGIEGQVQPTENGYSLVDTSDGMTRTLEVDTASGGYVYQNTNTLWVPPAPGQPSALPGPDEAVALANGFFLANAQALPGAQYRVNGEGFTESTSEVKKSSALLGAEQVVQTEGVDVMVSYGRNLAVGLAQGGVADVSVAGPGASTKYYIAPSETVQAAAAAGPAGLMGGSRDVAATGHTVPVQGPDKAWDAFLDDHQLAIVTIPLDADTFVRHPVSDTLAYYEQPHGISQQEMIPVYVFTADLFKGNELLAANSLIYVPVSPDYYPPNITITAPAPGYGAVAGQKITFTAEATGGFQPFTYAWSDSVDGSLGSGATIQAALSGSPRPDQAEVVPHTVSVVVANANGQSRTVNVTVNVGMPVYMPMLQRLN